MPLARARVPLLDRGHLLGDGLFETLRASAGRVLFRERHLARLARGLAALGVPEAVAEAEKALDALVEAGGPGQVMFRLQVTTGVSEGFLPAAGRFAVTGLVRPLRAYPPETYTSGVAVAVEPSSRPVPASLVGAKPLSMSEHVQARRRAQRDGATDAILLNVRGRVCEATTSNVLAVVGETVHAPGPEEGAVDGVTRAWALHELRREGRRVVTELELGDLLRADEVVLTNTIGGPVPVVQLRPSGRRPAGPAGRLYQDLRGRHRALTSGP